MRLLENLSGFFFECLNLPALGGNLIRCDAKRK